MRAARVKLGAVPPRAAMQTCDADCGRRRQVEGARVTKTFLLGVGAQKAGTTWVYRYLRSHPACAMGPIKEYAVFDTHERPELFSGRSRNRFERLRHEAERRIRLVGFTQSRPIKHDRALAATLVRRLLPQRIFSFKDCLKCLKNGRIRSGC